MTTDHLCAASRDGRTCLQPAVALVRARQLVGAQRVDRTMYVCAEHQRLGFAPSVPVCDRDGIFGVIVEVNGNDVTVATDVDGFGPYVHAYDASDLQIISGDELRDELRDPDLVEHYDRIVAYAAAVLAERQQS